jgi:NADH dehydrogenase FAD-containing subunit
MSALDETGSSDDLNPALRRAGRKKQFMENKTPKRILIVGGGFAGLTVAMELERRLGGGPSVEIALINRENFFLFTPMLHEVAASDLDLTTIVNPVRQMLRCVNFLAGEVDKIDLEQKTVIVSHGFDHHPHTPRIRFSGFRSRVHHEHLWASWSARTRAHDEVAG